MRERTTRKTLDLLAGIINELTGNPTEYWVQSEYSKKINGTDRQSIGHYYVQSQLGGVRLEQLCEHGAKDVFPYRTTKGQLENDMRRFIEGLELGKELNE
jgi:hypothetical protein